MTNGIERRLQKLESVIQAKRTVFVWRGFGVTQEAAIAERFPEGVPADVQIVLYCWQEPDEDAA